MSLAIFTVIFVSIFVFTFFNKVFVTFLLYPIASKIEVTMCPTILLPTPYPTTLL